MADGLGSGPDEGQFAIVVGLIRIRVGLIKSGICVFGGENGGRETKRHCVVIETVGK